MAASSAYLGEYAPGYKITKRGPEALARTFDAAIADKEAKGENYTSFGYGSGSPQKNFDEKLNPRFAGEILLNGGLAGPFGKITNEKDNPNQENLKIWTQQFAGGPFSPFGPPPMGAPEPGSEATA